MAQAGSLIWLVAGASLLAAVTRVAVPPLAWVALTCLLHATRSMPLGSGLSFLWVALYATSAVGWRGVLPASGPIFFVLVAFIATAVVAPFAVDRLLASRFGVFTGTLIFPMALVAMEFLRSRTGAGATWGSIAYTQYGYLPLMQLTAVVGIWGITFLIAWFASTVETTWARGFAWGEVRGPVLACFGVIAAAIVGGGLRLAMAPTDRPSLRAATLNRPTDLFIPGEITRISEGRVSTADRAHVSDQLARLHDWFLEGSRREARAGARLVVWPEGSLLVFAEDEAAFLDRAKRLAAGERVYLAMGMGTIHLGERLPFENKLVVIDPSGHAVMSYLKSHAVMGWEAGIMRAGPAQVPVVATDAGRLAGVICFDADFPEYVRQAAQASADLLILPANDWREVKTMHFQMQAFRAIENGLPVVRSAASGLSSAFDPWGRLLGVADFFAPGDRTMTAQVPLGGIRTLYATIGDVLAWLCLAGVLTACAIGYFQPVGLRVNREGSVGLGAGASGSPEASRISRSRSSSLGRPAS